MFVRCKWSLADDRSYTYVYTGETPLIIGQRVLVEGRAGRTAKVYVAELGVEQPRDEDGKRVTCKAIIGPAPDETHAAEAALRA